MGKVYFGSSKNLTDDRNAFLETNRELLTKVLFFLRTKEFRQKELSQSYIEINHIVKKIQKARQANTLTEKETQKIINYFQENLGIEKEVSLFGNLLVDYMYELSRKFYNEIYDEDTLRKMLSGQMKSQDEFENQYKQGDTFDEPKELVNGGLRYPRNQSLTSQVIRNANYMCEVDKEHLHFKSATTNNNYVEAHHLIPLAYQNEYKISLDIIENMVSLCVVCHKKIHYAIFREKESILIGLYNKKVVALKEGGIDVSLNDFLRYYQENLNEEW